MKKNQEAMGIIIDILDSLEKVHLILQYEIALLAHVDSDFNLTQKEAIGQYEFRNLVEQELSLCIQMLVQSRSIIFPSVKEFRMEE